MSLSVDLISDIHVDNWPGIERVYKPSPGVKIAVVAGDLNSSPALAAQELERIHRAYPIVLVVDGNNEGRLLQQQGIFRPGAVAAAMRMEITALNATAGNDLSPALRSKRWDADTSKDSGIWYLNDGPFVDKETGAAIIGRNGWWDHEADPRVRWQDAQQQQFVKAYAVLNNGEAPPGETVPENLLKDIRLQQARQKLAADFSKAAAPKHIPVTLADIASQRQQALRDFRALGKEMLALSNDKTVKTIAVVTHTVPHIPGTTLLDFGGGKWSALTMSTMGNTRLHKLNSDACDPQQKFGTHMFGHQHAERNETHAGVRYVSYPTGRPGEIKKDGAVYTTRKVEIAPRHAARP